MKYIIVIGDGMADNPVPILNGCTPLEAAQTPVFDELAPRSTIGLGRTVPTEVPPGSDTAILSICGYDPRRYYTGRAPLEAAGAGVRLVSGDVAYRCNMVSLDGTDVPFEETVISSHNGGSIDGETAQALMRDLLAQPGFAQAMQKAKMRIEVSPSFRHIAVQSGTSIDGLRTIPPHDHLGEVIGPLLPQGGPSAGLVDLMRQAHLFLKEHPANLSRIKQGKPPANGLWFWAEGTVAALPPFKGLFGKTGFVVSAVPLVWGIGALAGLDKILVDGATGELDTNYEGKAEAVLEGLRGAYDFALLHIEAPDECTHMGDLSGKLEAIKRLNTRALRPLLQGMDAWGEDYRLLIVSDHKTLTDTRGHDGDPIPFLLYDSRQAVSGPTRYTEPNAANGVLVEDGVRLISMLFEQD